MSPIPAHLQLHAGKKREGDLRPCMRVCVGLWHCECGTVFHAHRHFVLFSCQFFVHFMPLQIEYRTPIAYCSGSEVTQTQNSYTIDSIQLRVVVAAAAAIRRGSTHNLTRSLIIIILHVQDL